MPSILGFKFYTFIQKVIHEGEIIIQNIYKK